MEKAFDEKFYMSMLKTADSVGMSIIPLHKACKLMAILLVYGGGDESITNSPKLACDVKFLQEKYHIHGAGIPPVEFVECLKGYVKELESAKECPQWVKDFMKENYNFILKGV